MPDVGEGVFCDRNRRSGLVLVAHYNRLIKPSYLGYMLFPVTIIEAGDADGFTARGGVDDAIVSIINGDMADFAAIKAKEDQIALL